MSGSILSVVSWFSVPMQGAYCASKAAAWSLTKSVRFDERARATRAELLKDDRPFDARMQLLWDSARGK